MNQEAYFTPLRTGSLGTSPQQLVDSALTSTDTRPASETSLPFQVAGTLLDSLMLASSLPVYQALAKPLDPHGPAPARVSMDLPFSSLLGLEVFQKFLT